MPSTYPPHRNFHSLLRPPHVSCFASFFHIALSAEPQQCQLSPSTLRGCRGRSRPTSAMRLNISGPINREAAAAPWGLFSRTNTHFHHRSSRHGATARPRGSAFEQLTQTSQPRHMMSHGRRLWGATRLAAKGRDESKAEAG